MNNIVKNIIMLAGGVIATGFGTWLTGKATGAIQGEAFKASLPSSIKDLDTSMDTVATNLLEEATDGE